MKIFVCFFLAFLFFSEVNGQRLTLGVELVPKFGLLEFTQKELVDTERIANFGFGSNIYFDLNNRIQFYSGLSISWLPLKFTDYSVIFECDIDGVTGPIESSSIQRNSFYQIQHDIFYFGIPFHVKFKINENTNHIYSQFGLDFMLPIKSDTETKLIECGIEHDDSDGEFFRPRKILITPSIGSGYEFKFSKKIKMYLELRLEYAINKIYQNPGSFQSNGILNNVKSHSLSLVFGMRFID